MHPTKYVCVCMNEQVETGGSVVREIGKVVHPLVDMELSREFMISRNPGNSPTGNCIQSVKEGRVSVDKIDLIR